MNKQEKNQVIDRLADKLSGNPHFYLADTSALTVEVTNNLRRKCFEKGVSLEVVKNKLLLKAMEKSGDGYAQLYEILAGPTSILFSEVANEPAKIIKEFRKTYDKPILKGAFVEESIYIGDEQAVAGFIQRHHLQGKAAYFRTKSNGRPWFPVLYGIYPSRSAAVAARAKLPKNLASQGVWPRSLASVQQAIREK